MQYFRGFWLNFSEIENTLWRRDSRWGTDGNIISYESEIPGQVLQKGRKKAWALICAKKWVRTQPEG